MIEGQYEVLVDQNFAAEAGFPTDSS